MADSDSNQEYVKELEELLAVAKHPKVVALLKDAIKRGDAGTVTEPLIQKPVSVSKPSGDIATSNSTRITQYGWDQNEKFVKIYITSINGLADLKKEDIRHNFKRKSMEVELCRIKGRNYSIVLNDLFAAIIPEESSVKVRSGTVTISLCKEKKENWSVITGREKKKEPKKNPDKDADPGLGLMKMMKKMYDEGDDEMKRSIAKAWHESQEKKSKGEYEL